MKPIVETTTCRVPTQRRSVVMMLIAVVLGQLLQSVGPQVVDTGIARMK